MLHIYYRQRLRDRESLVRNEREKDSEKNASLQEDTKPLTISNDRQRKLACPSKRRVVLPLWLKASWLLFFVLEMPRRRC